jgi:hypothetical protein
LSQKKKKKTLLLSKTLGKIRTPWKSQSGRPEVQAKLGFTKPEVEGRKPEPKVEAKVEAEVGS